MPPKYFVFPHTGLCALVMNWFCGNPSANTMPLKFSGCGFERPWDEVQISEDERDDGGGDCRCKGVGDMGCTKWRLGCSKGDAAVQKCTAFV